MQNEKCIRCSVIHNGDCGFLGFKMDAKVPLKYHKSSLYFCAEFQASELKSQISLILGQIIQFSFVNYINRFIQKLQFKIMINSTSLMNSH